MLLLRITQHIQCIPLVGNLHFFDLLGQFAGNGGLGNRKRCQSSILHFESIGSLSVDILCASDVVYKVLIWVNGVFFFMFQWWEFRVCGWFLCCFSDGESSLGYCHVILFHLVGGFMNVYLLVFPIDAWVYLIQPR